MDTRVKYFKYRFLRSLVIYPFAILFAVLLTSTAVYKGWWTSTAYLNLNVMNPFVAMYSMFVPVYELYQFNNKRNLDLWFSLPISRKSILGVHYISGFINILLVSLISLASIVVRMNSFGNYFCVSAIWPYWGWYILYAVIVYSLSFFAFNLANNTFDGCVFILGYYFVVSYVVSSIVYFYAKLTDQYTSIHHNRIRFVSITESIDNLGNYFENKCLRSYMMDGSWLKEAYPMATLSLCIWFVATLALVALTLFLSERRDSSKVGGVSDHVLGYQSLIPAYIGSFILTNISGEFGLIIGFGISTVILYTVYRRGFKYKLVDYVSAGALMGLFILVNVLGSMLGW